MRRYEATVDDLEFSQRTGACEPEAARKYKGPLPAQ